MASSPADRAVSVSRQSEPAASSVSLEQTQGIAALAGLVFIVAAILYGLSLYPFARQELALGLIVYALAVLWRPALTFLLLLPLLTLLNLAPWSGSLFFEEYDLFVLANIGALLVRRQYVFNIPLGRMQWAFLLLIILSTLLSLVRIIDQLPPIDPHGVFSYDSPSNALRVAKGLAWPLLLLPGLAALWQKHRQQSQAYLSWGFALSAFAIGLVAMWERGVFAAIAHSGSAYVILATLLDFTSQYRITGMFSEMHIGGESIDGFVTLVWPFGILLALTARDKRARVAGVIAHFCIVYATVTTFSRASYLAAGIGAVVLTLYLLRLWTLRVAASESAAGLAAIAQNALALVTVAVSFIVGGFITMYAGLAIWGAAVLSGRRGWHLVGYRLFVVAALLTAGPLAYGMGASKWVQNSIPATILVSLTLAASLVFCGSRLGRGVGATLSRQTLATLVVIVVGTTAIVTPAILGHRMKARFATSATDIPTRVGHWQTANKLMDPDVESMFLGKGLGQFPHEFTKGRIAGKEDSFSIEEQADNRYLRLVEGSNLRLTQRVSVAAHSKQTLSFRLRSVAESFKLRVRLCRRHIIPALEKDPRCLVYERDLHDTGGKWEDVRWHFNAGPIGDDGSFGRQPLTLEIANLRDCGRRFLPTSVIDIDDIALKDAAGINTIRNGNFTDSSSHWFPHWDWSHMRWHLKNTWENIYFDQGLLGVTSFAGFVLALLAGLISHNWSRHEWRDNSFATAGMLSLASFLALSPLGSPLDAPRLSLIAYLLFFALALDARMRSRPRPAS